MISGGRKPIAARTGSFSARTRASSASKSESERAARSRRPTSAKSKPAALICSRSWPVSLARYPTATAGGGAARAGLTRARAVASAPMHQEEEIMGEHATADPGVRTTSAKGTRSVRTQRHLMAEGAIDAALQGPSGVPGQGGEGVQAAREDGGAAGGQELIVEFPRPGDRADDPRDAA